VVRAWIKDPTSRQLTGEPFDEYEPQPYFRHNRYNPLTRLAPIAKSGRSLDIRCEDVYIQQP
jgi:hypothetical protein